MIDPAQARGEEYPWHSDLSELEADELAEAYGPGIVERELEAKVG